MIINGDDGYCLLATYRRACSLKYRRYYCYYFLIIIIITYFMLNYVRLTYFSDFLNDYVLYQ